MHARVLAFITVTILVPSSIHAAPAHSWSHLYGNSAEQTLSAVAIDPFGNVLLVGSFYGSITFASTHNSAGQNDMFVAKLSPTGTPVWSKRLGALLSDTGTAITSDPVGNVIAVGRTGYPNNQLTVVKYAPDGTLHWTRLLGIVGSVHTSRAVATNRAKEIILAGDYSGAFFGGNDSLVVGADNLFLARFDQNGNTLLARPIESGDGSLCMDVGVDALSQIVMYGQFTGAVDFGNGNLTSLGFNDVYAAKFMPDGTPIWNHSFGSATIDEGTCFALSESGRVAMGVNLYGPIDFGGGALTPSTSPEPCIAVLAADGTHLWSRIMESSVYGIGLSIDFADNSDLLYSCNGTGTIDFGGGPVASTGASSSLFLARLYQNTGAHRWSTQLASDGSLAGSIAESNNTLIVAGTVDVDVDFGGGTLTNAGETDVFAARFSETLTGIVNRPAPATLLQNVPNPFNPGTTIGYTLGAPADVAIVIYNAAGQTVRRIAQGPRPAGAHATQWNGRDDAGIAVASGVYFYRLEGAPGVAARKMVLLK